MATPLPGRQAPRLSVPLVSGETDSENSAGERPTWTLAEQRPENLTLVVFYRGLHCPICKSYNKKLQSLLGDFAERGVEVIAVSMDERERAAQAVDEWGLDELRVGYGLRESDAREWGLYLSEGIKEEEPDLFSEPGLFLVKPDGTLYYAATNSMPIGRPDLADLTEALDFLLDNDYPARGEVPARQVA